MAWRMRLLLVVAALGMLAICAGSQPDPPVVAGRD